MKVVRTRGKIVVCGRERVISVARPSLCPRSYEKWEEYILLLLYDPTMVMMSVSANDAGNNGVLMCLPWWYS